LKALNKFDIKALALVAMLSFVINATIPFLPSSQYSLDSDFSRGVICTSYGLKYVEFDKSGETTTRQHCKLCMLDIFAKLKTSTDFSFYTFKYLFVFIEHFSAEYILDLSNFNYLATINI
jgi:hypothetical protein